MLADPAALLVWATRVALMDEDEALSVRAAWHSNPGAGAVALSTVQDLREALRAVLLAALGSSPDGGRDRPRARPTASLVGGRAGAVDVVPERRRQATDTSARRCPRPGDDDRRPCRRRGDGPAPDRGRRTHAAMSGSGRRLRFALSRHHPERLPPVVPDGGLRHPGQGPSAHGAPARRPASGGRRSLRRTCGLPPCATLEESCSRLRALHDRS